MEGVFSFVPGLGGKEVGWSKGSSPATRCWNLKAALSLIESWASRVACKQEAVLLCLLPSKANTRIQKKRIEILGNFNAELCGRH
jgi:hypothetical protein